jgi:uronate dehydrogenase
MTKPFKRILFTGAAGNLGRRLRDHLHQFADIVRLSDAVDFGPARAGEEIVLCDLANRDQVFAMCEGVDAIIHFGGVSTEQPFAPIMDANILGTVNLYEAVHKLGIKRVVFASSNHAVGMYPTTTQLDSSMPVRPDGYYGLSKVWGEALSRFYWDRFGIETVCLRIGYCFPEPTTHRQANTWLSLDDLVQLLRRSLTVPCVGHTIAFGVSDNPGTWWNNSQAKFLGYAPKDSSARFPEPLQGAVDYANNEDITLKYQGGQFLVNGPKYPS